METDVIVKALKSAIEVEENIALKMLLIYSLDKIEKMQNKLLEAADIIGEHASFYALAENLRAAANN